MENEAKTILIIEDSITEQQMLKRKFVEKGFNVFCASDGEEGVQKAGEVKPDLVVIDTVLPDIDGFETCKRIKALEGIEPKLIINTGKIDAVDTMKSIESGADEYCVKTSDLSKLVDMVKQLLS